MSSSSPSPPGGPARAAAGCLSGMVKLVNSAMSAMIAITDSDERSALMRAFAFSSTISSAVALGTFALSRAA